MASELTWAAGTSHILSQLIRRLVAPDSNVTWDPGHRDVQISNKESVKALFHLNDNLGFGFAT